MIIRSLYILFTGIIHLILRKKSKYATAFSSLMNPISFRLLGQEENGKPLIVISYLKKSYSLIFALNHISEIESDGLAFFASSKKSALSLKSYVDAFLGNEVKQFTAKDIVGTPSIVIKVGLLITVTFICPFLLLISLVSKHRASIALYMLEWVENILLCDYCYRHKIKKLYYVGGYERDANFATLLLNTIGTQTLKIPSSNPLLNFYKKCVSNTLFLTAPYQKKEIAILKDKYEWYVDEVKEIPIVNYQNLLPYLNRETENFRKVPCVAFVSSGIWLREKLGHSVVYPEAYDSEKELLKMLKKLLALKKYGNISFHVMLHPLERKTIESYKESCEFYRNYFDEIEVHFLEREKTSYMGFADVDIAIAAYSSMNMERLFCGYKTLYAPICMNRNYFSGDNIENICAWNEQDLDALIIETLEMDTNEFFSHYKIEDYHYKHQLI